MKGICLHEKQGHTVPWLIALKTLIYIDVLRFFKSSQQSIISLNTNIVTSTGCIQKASTNIKTLALHHMLITNFALYID